MRECWCVRVDAFTIYLPGTLSRSDAIARSRLLASRPDHVPLVRDISRGTWPKAHPIKSQPIVPEQICMPRLRDRRPTRLDIRLARALDGWSE